MSHDETNRGSNKRQIARLIGSSSRPMFVLSEEQTIVFVNEAMEEFLDLEADQLLGLRCDSRAATSESPLRALSLWLALPPTYSHRDVYIAHSTRISVQKSENGSPLGCTMSESLECLRCIIPLESILPCCHLCILGDARNLPLASFIDEPASRIHDALVDARTRYRLPDTLWFLTGNSARIERTRHQMDSVSQTHQPLMLIGPKGSGREQLACEAHRLRCQLDTPADPVLATLECGLMDNALLAGTLEAIHESNLARMQEPSLLLADFDELPAESHATLARFLTSNPRIHWIATSSTDRFAERYPGSATWEMLCSKIDIARIEIPALGDRSEDLPILVAAWGEAFATEQKLREPIRWDPKTLDALMAYPWPGDIDELSQALRQAHASAGDRPIQESDLPSGMRTFPSHVEQTRNKEGIDLDKTLEEIERTLILRAIERFPRNRTSAAKLLGISRARLLRRLQQWGIQAEPETADDSDDSPVFRELSE